MAAAVFIDATLIRLVLAPAAMVLLGRVGWWLPGPLARRGAPAAAPELPAVLADAGAGELTASP
jgi:RND superfamily putative drug exporter